MISVLSEFVVHYLLAFLELLLVEFESALLLLELRALRTRHDYLVLLLPLQPLLMNVGFHCVVGVDEVCLVEAIR